MIAAFFLLIANGHAAQALNEVISTIPVGGNLPFLVAHPDGTRMYVADQSRGSVFVIDTQTETVSSTITVGAGPNPMAITPNGATLYVVNWLAGTVSVIATASNTVTATVTVSGSADIRAIQVTPDGSKYVLTDLSAGELKVYSTSTNALLASVTTGAGAQYLAISPDSASAYVTNLLASTVSVVDLSAYTATTVALGSAPRSLALSPDGSLLFVGHSTAPQLSVIDTGSNSVSTVTTGYRADSLAASGTTVFAGAYQIGSVVVAVDVSTLAVEGVIPVADKVRQVVLSPSAPLGYAVGETTATVTSFSTSTLEVLASIPVGGSPWRAAFVPSGEKLYVSSGTGSVTVIDTYLPVSRDTSQDPIAPMQQYALTSGATVEQCAEQAPQHVDWPGIAGRRGEGWSVSYAEWPHEGQGGWVCSRQPIWQGAGWGFART